MDVPPLCSKYVILNVCCYDAHRILALDSYDLAPQNEGQNQAISSGITASHTRDLGSRPLRSGIWG
jgi:hypothetical protein